MSHLWRAATLIWMTLILAGSLLPSTLGAPGGTGWHLAGYAVLGVLLSRGLAGWLAWIVGTGYGAAIEVLQWAVPYRAAELADVAVNAMGVAAGVLAGTLVVRRLRG